MKEKDGSNSFPTGDNEESINVTKWLLIFSSHWYYFAICIILGTIGAFTFCQYAHPIYEAETTILIKEDSKLPIAVPNSLLGLEKNNVQNEIGILRSKTLTQETINDLNFPVSTYVNEGFQKRELYQNCPLIVEVDHTFRQAIDLPVFIQIIDDHSYIARCKTTQVTSIYDFTNFLKIDSSFEAKDLSVKLKYGEWFSKNSLRFRLFPKNESSLNSASKKDKFFFISINNATKFWTPTPQSTIKLADKSSSIVSIKTKDRHPQKAIDFVNKLAELYLQKNLEEKSRTHISTIEFVDSQISIIADSLTQAEKQREDFQKQNNTMNLEGESKILFEKAGALESLRAGAETNAKYYQYLLDYIVSSDQTTTPIAPATMGIKDPLLNTLVHDMSNKISERERLSSSSTGKNPQLQRLDSEIENIKRQLLENIKNIIKLSEIEKKSIDERIQQNQTQIDKLPSTERHMIKIERQFKFNDGIYTFLYQKRAEAEIAKNAVTPDHKILDVARFAQQIFPKKKIIFALAFFLSLVVPVLFLIIKEFCNTKIDGAKDIEKVSDGPIVGYVEDIVQTEKEERFIVTKNPRSGIAENFRLLRTNLLFLSKGRDRFSIVVTSSEEGDGKSFIAGNLASIFSLSGKRVLIAEYDLRKPLYAKLLGQNNIHGISTYLSNKSSLEDIIFQTPYENLDVALAGPIPPNPSELIDSPENSALVAKLKEMYDIVIFDTPPIGLISDAFILTQQSADLLLYVVREGKTRRSVFQRIVTDIQQKEIAKLNFVLNSSSFSSSGIAFNKKYGGGYFSYGQEAHPSKKKFFSFFSKKK